MEDPEIRRRKIKEDRLKDKVERDSTAPDGERESPPAKKRKVRKSSVYEDIIDGFAIRSFKTYEDLERAVGAESGEPQALNESQEGARLSGSGSGDNTKVGANESPNKESGKSSASTKSPKTKKKKLSTTDQENNASVMQPDLSRCSGESGDHVAGNGSFGPGNGLEAGMSHSLNTTHPHSFSNFQQHFPHLDPITALKPHPQHPKKIRIGKEELRKNPFCKMEDENDVANKRPDDHKELFGTVRRGDPIENLHRHPSQVKVGENSQHSTPLGSDLKGNRPPNTATSTDHNKSPHSSSSTLTQYAFQNHQKGQAGSDNSERKSENSEGSTGSVIKSFTNGPLSPTKRQLELNGRSHKYEVEQRNSQAAFTPSQPSPKASGSLQPAQQQVVAPVSNPKEKFGQGRIGSQTLFTPYATTAITRVRSPLGGGGPPSVSNVSGSQSSVTVIDQESPKEPSGSPYPSVPNVKNNHFHNRVKGSPNNYYGSGSTTSPNSFHGKPTNQQNPSSSSVTKVFQAHNNSDYNRSKSPERDSLRKEESEEKNRVPSGSRANPLPPHKIPTPTKEKAPAPTTKSSFGSIARLLDSPASSSSSTLKNHPQSNHLIPSHHSHALQHHHHYAYGSSQAYRVASSISATQSIQHPGSSSSAGSNSSVTTIPIAANNHGGNQTSSLAASASTQSCSSRSHSPRGHSPTRERDSYSSNVSSLSRSSATPVSGSQISSHLPLPPNLSPQLQTSSYSKAASWLSSVPGLSPVPRPTPPPVSLPTHPLGPLTSVGSPFGSYSHGLVSPHPSAANMFAPPILPLSSISAHPASQAGAFGPDQLFPGPSTSDIVRRDLESRLISGDRTVTGGPSPFLSRPSDLHPHHPLLPPLSGVGHLPHGPGAPPTAPHSSLFPPPLFKDLPKVGLDSPFYRTSMGFSYPGFNGLLPPPGLTTPFAPPTQLPTYTQKKTGKWNAMHVRIAWEIYQHQQKGGGGGEGLKSASSSSASSSSSKAIPSSAAVGSSSVSPAVSASSSVPPPTSLAADLLRQSNHAFTGLGRSGEGPPHFSAPMLSPHAPPPHASPRGTPYDPLFLNSTASHLGPPLPRYPGFGALGPTFGGALSGLGSSLLGRDLSSLVALSPGQDQWARFPTRPPFPGPSGSLGGNWQVQRLEQRDSKTPTETRRPKETDAERPSRHSDSRESRESRRDSSPFRDRSPIRPVRTPHENGDGDSRSSRSNDSHNSTSAVHSHSKSSRSKEDSVSSNGEREKATTPVLSTYERERMAQGVLADKSVPSHASRIYPPASPLNPGMPGMSAWDAFPGFLGAPRMGLNLLQLSERERELARIPPTGRSPLFANGPYGPLPLGVLGGPSPLSSAAPSAATSTSATSKSSPISGPLPLLNASIPPSPVSQHSHLHSSQNGPRSPSPPSSGKSQEEKPAPPSSSHRTKEESHQSR